MLFSYLSLGALAVTANAFLVPLYSDEPNNDGLNSLSINQGPQTTTLDCSNCPYALQSERNGQHEWTTFVPNDLEMTLEVANNAITFNGVTIFPVTNPGSPPVLTVKQVVKKGAETSMKGLDRDLRLSYSLEMTSKPFDDGNSLIIISISPMALDGEMIRIDDLEIKAIQDSAGTVRPILDSRLISQIVQLTLLQQVTLHTVETITPPPNGPDAQCSNVMCRVMSKLLSGITRIKTAAKAATHKVKCLCVKCFHCVMHLMGHKPHHKGHHAPPGVPHRLADGTLELPTHHHFKPQDGRPHHHQKWQHKSFFGRMAHIMWLTVKIAFVPILIGIAFGMAASAIGMLVGQAVVLLWIRYRRNDEAPAYEELPSDEKEEVPPPYEDLPAAVQEAINEKDMEDKA